MVLTWADGPEGRFKILWPLCVAKGGVSSVTPPFAGHSLSAELGRLLCDPLGTVTTAC
jgi:hypothetical protein